MEEEEEKKIIIDFENEARIISDKFVEYLNEMEEEFNDGQKSVCTIRKLGLDPLLSLVAVFARYKAQSISSKQGCGFIKCKQPPSREACKKLAACLF